LAGWLWRGEIRPLEKRREALSQLVAGIDAAPFSEGLTAEGAIVFAHACKLGLEGIVSKRAGSLYRSGTSRNWPQDEEPEFRQDVIPMKRTRLFGRPRGATILVALALSAFAIVAFRSLREPVLRAAGWALVVNNEPVAPADIIVLAIDSDGAGALEAADLVQSGVSKRVAVFEDPPSREGSEFIRRGLSYEDEGARQIRQLRTLGVTDVVQISRVNGTGDEGQVLPQWANEQHLRSVVVVATKDHSRRLQRVLYRTAKGHPTHFTVQAARHSNFDPDRWWETRNSARTEIVELQKLLLDAVLHPLSF
jgi:hypothetical protein